jgi:hypothetical protein
LITALLRRRRMRQRLWLADEWKRGRKSTFSEGWNEQGGVADERARSLTRHYASNRKVVWRVWNCRRVFTTKKISGKMNLFEATSAPRSMQSRRCHWLDPWSSCSQHGPFQEFNVSPTFRPDPPVARGWWGQRLILGTLPKQVPGATNLDNFKAQRRHR